MKNAISPHRAVGQAGRSRIHLSISLIDGAARRSGSKQRVATCYRQFLEAACRDRSVARIRLYEAPCRAIARAPHWLIPTPCPCPEPTNTNSVRGPSRTSKSVLRRAKPPSNLRISRPRTRCPFRTCRTRQDDSDATTPRTRHRPRILCDSTDRDVRRARESWLAGIATDSGSPIGMRRIVLILDVDDL